MRFVKKDNITKVDMEEGQFLFIKRLTNHEMVEIAGEDFPGLIIAKKGYKELGQYVAAIRKLLTYAIRGWEGFKDKDGNEVKFSKEELIALIDSLDNDSNENNWNRFILLSIPSMFPRNVEAEIKNSPTTSSTSEDK